MKNLSDTLPPSKITFPSDSLINQLKYVFWRVYTPYHPYVRDVCLSLGILKHGGRQNFLLGNIAPDRSIDEVVAYLVEQGFGNHFIAWRDEGEVYGLRYVESFTRQYHIRIFEDGEVRGHYEYTPECYPLLHFRAIGQEDCRSEFSRILGDRITLATVN